MSHQTKRRIRKHTWAVCSVTRKQRLGERKDVKLALAEAQRLRWRAEGADLDCSWQVQRGYRCRHCNGWHLTSRQLRAAPTTAVSRRDSSRSK
jgi:hypothetical protein